MALLSDKKSAILLLIILCCVFSLTLFYSDHGLMRLFSLRQEKIGLEAAIYELHQENSRLLNQIERIKTDDRYIEDEARKKLGLIRPDEVIYRLAEEPDSCPQ